MVLEIVIVVASAVVCVIALMKGISGPEVLGMLPLISGLVLRRGKKSGNGEEGTEAEEDLALS